MNAPHVMLDLETADSRPTAAIVSIGAVIFHGDGTGREFYAAVDLQSSLDAGCTKSEATLAWWAQQSEAARAVFTDPARVSLAVALQALASFIDPQARVWGNGASFDNAIMANAYAAMGMPLPWKFWNDRCYRTVSAIAPTRRQQGGTHHNALDDAKSQADHLLTFGRGFLV